VWRSTTLQYVRGQRRFDSCSTLAFPLQALDGLHVQPGQTVTVVVSELMDGGAVAVGLLSYGVRAGLLTAGLWVIRCRNCSGGSGCWVSF
jgi:hypothetical protein